MVYPYLSDIVEKIEPQKSFVDIKPDIIVLTHNHLNHTLYDDGRKLIGRALTVPGDVVFGAGGCVLFIPSYIKKL